MKKTATLGALLLALALPLAAQAETVFAGEVTAGTTQVIAAPYGGLVEDVRVRVGDSVKIIDGPLEGFVGIVKEISMQQQLVTVTVSMLGRETPVELKFNQVASLEK